MQSKHPPGLDASVLGQLLLMQSILGNLPDEQAVFQFVCQGLRDIPGVKGATYRPEGDCATPTNCRCYELQAGQSTWGILCLELSDASRLSPYEPYLQNFCFMLAVLLEERRQRRLNEQHNRELEQRVAERTISLDLARQRAEQTAADLHLEMTKRLHIEQALRETESKQRAMIANIADVIAIVDRDGINRYKSPNIERWYGWRPEELVGISTWDNIHPDDLPLTQAAMAEILKAPHLTRNGECRYRCKDGSYKWSEFTVINCLDHPDIHGFLINYHDITDRKRVAEENEKLQSQLIQSQKMESIGRLAGGVAHDFNNMLSVILGNAELAIEETRPEEPIHAELQEILASAQRSADLTRQLLAFARKQTITPRVLDLNHTVAGMLGMLRRLIGENISLLWKPGVNLPQVKIDPAQIDQILANLTVNARDAIAGTGQILIETTKVFPDGEYCTSHLGSPQGEYILLAVNDNGGGMDKETLAHIFEPFFTTKEVGAGTGLGLSTVYGIVKQNNGFIDVQSELGRGTTFRIFLPVHRGKADQPAGDGPATGHIGGNETVLLVEDEKSLLRLARTQLERLGYSVLVAHSPGQAIHLAEKHNGRIDLLITDVIMPEMNGRDLAKRLLASYPNLKRLFMSGYTADVIAHHGVLDESVNFIQKPFKAEYLAAKVRQTLDKE